MDRKLVFMGKVKIESVYPLTAMQQGIYYETQLNTNSQQYFIQNVFHMIGCINSEYMKTCLKLLSAKYDVLRTRIIMSKKEEKPLQVILKEQVIEMNEVSCVGVKQEQILNEVDRIAKEDLERGFQLSKDSLVRLTIIHIADNECYMIWNAHHIIIDGWCTSIVMKEFIEFYCKLCEGDSALKLMHQVNIQKSRIAPFSEYVKWQEKQDKEAALTYWKQYLEGYQTTASIPPMCIAKSHKETMRVHNISLNQDLTFKLVNIAKECKVTISNIAEMIWGIVLMKYCRLDDIVFGKIVSGRNADIKGIEQAVGIYINIVPERITINKESTFYTVLKQISEDYHAGAKYDYCALSEVQSCVELKNNLIGSIFTFENFYGATDAFEDTEYCSIRVHSYREETNYGLSLSVDLTDTLNFNILYNPNIYSEQELESIGRRIDRIAKNIEFDVNQVIQDMVLVAPEEKEQILTQFNVKMQLYDTESTINTMFEKVVFENGDRIAVVSGTEAFTYKELNRRADCLAMVLREKGVLPGDFVAVFTERKAETVIAFLAIQKAGGVYLPLDSHQPFERIHVILEDAKPKLMLTMNPIDNYEGMKVDLCDGNIYEREGKKQNNPNTQESLSYVIYTSGTTGKPKGVLLTHKGVVNLAYFLQSEFEIGREDRIAQFANYVFDASIWEFTMAFLTGASLYILTKEEIDDPNLCESFLGKNQITIMTVPPLYCKQLELPNMRLIITAGSPTDELLVAKVKDRAQYVNAYGPTEDTVCSTFYKYKEPSEHVARIPIGKPVLNHQVYIMQGDQLCPVGMPGELCISGCGLAMKYLNRQQLTEEKFQDNLFGDGKMYRSGDLARWLPDGNIDFMGRIDQQVKIRGFRIELEEISNVLMTIDNIDMAATIVKENKEVGKNICSFFTSDKEVDCIWLKSELAKFLPDYMIPAYLVQIEQMPINTSGKVDTKELQKVSIIVNQVKERPANEYESNVEKIFCEILGLEEVDVETSFFELGGESILAMKLMVMIENKLEAKVSIADIFKHNTVRELAQLIRKRGQDDSNLELQGLENSEHKSRDEILKPKHTYNLDSVLSEIMSQVNDYRNSVISDNMVTGSELFLSQQLLYKLGIRSSCGFIKIKGTYTVSEIENAWRKTLTDQVILRSTIKLQEENSEMMEYEVGTEWKLPYADIQDMATEQKKVLIREIEKISEFFDKEEAYQGDSVNHAAVLLKETEREYLFILPCSHLVFDGFSNEVLYSVMKEYLDHPDKKEAVHRYSDYMKQMDNTSVLQMETIEKEFTINRFRDTVKEFADYMRDKCFTAMSFQYGFTNAEMEKLNEIKVLLNKTLFNDIIKFLFGNMKVPVYVVQSGRYSNHSTEYIGEFLDMIPIIYETEKNNFQEEQISGRIEYVRKNNLNMVSILNSFASFEREALLMEYPILYNNLLMYQFEDENEEQDTTLPDYAKRIVTISIRRNNLSVVCMCPVGQEKELEGYLQKTVSELVRRVR